jgi:hypothetical protein
MLPAGIMHVKGLLQGGVPDLCVLQAATAAAAAYCPTRESLCAAAGISDADLLLFVPETSSTRPAYAVWEDKEHKRLIWGFRGTTDLNVSSRWSLSCK